MSPFIKKKPRISKKGAKQYKRQNTSKIILALRNIKLPKISKESIGIAQLTKVKWTIIIERGLI